MLELKDLMNVSCGEFYHEEDDVPATKKVVEESLPYNMTSQELLERMSR